MDWNRFKLLTETAAEDRERFERMEQRKKDAPLSMPASLVEKPKNRTLVNIPAGFVVTRCEPGKANGLEPPQMRARGDRSSNTREPREDSKRKLLRQLEAMKGSISPAMYLAAKRRLGVK